MVNVHTSVKNADSTGQAMDAGTFNVKANGIDIDSLLRAQGIDPSKVKGKVEVKMTVDDADIKNNIEKDIEKKVSNADGSINEEKLKIMADSIGAVLGINFPEMVNSVVRIVQNAPDPKNLIPVLIKNDKGTKANELIFWYEPADVQALVNSGNANQASLEVKAPHGAINELSIYPNPARNEASVKFNLKDARTVSFAIHNLLGQKVQEVQTIPANAGSGEVSVNVSSLEPGLYLLVLSTDKGEQMIKRLVVER